MQIASIHRQIAVSCRDESSVSLWMATSLCAISPSRWATAFWTVHSQPQNSSMNTLRRCVNPFAAAKMYLLPWQCKRGGALHALQQNQLRKDRKEPELVCSTCCIDCEGLWKQRHLAVLAYAGCWTVAIWSHQACALKNWHRPCLHCWSSAAKRICR